MRKPPIAVTLAILAVAPVACRNAQDYREEADSVAAAYLEAGQAAAVGKTEPIEIETPADTLDARADIVRDADEQHALAKHAVGHEESARLGFDRRFRNGLRVTGSIMANLAGMLTGDTRTAWGSSADLSVSIPLLRGSGELVNAEPLTQAQRSFVYEVRAFEQYKRTFICDVESAYLALVLAKRQQQNQDEAFRRVILSTRRSHRMAEASRMSQAQFEQAHQSELSSKANWIASCQRYEPK